MPIIRVHTNIEVAEAPEVLKGARHTPKPGVH